MYQDALNAKKDRKNQEEYFILYKDQNNEFSYPFLHLMHPDTFENVQLNI